MRARLLPTPSQSVFLFGPRGTGVYLGKRPALWDDVHVSPLVEFSKRLWSGEVLP